MTRSLKESRLCLMNIIPGLQMDDLNLSQGGIK